MKRETRFDLPAQLQEESPSLKWIAHQKSTIQIKFYSSPESNATYLKRVAHLLILQLILNSS